LITSNVSKRYARAFFDVAGEEKQYEKYHHELRRFASVVAENRGLKDFLLNPVFEEADKKNIVDKVLEKLDLSSPTANFFRLLLEKGRIGNIAEIEENYRKLMDQAIGIARVQVKTAFTLTPELSGSLKRGIESVTGKKVEMEVEEDGSLLGGVVVRVGDQVYDGSVKAQLNNMMKLLGEEI